MQCEECSRDLHIPRNTGIKVIIDLHGAPGSQVRDFLRDAAPIH